MAVSPTSPRTIHDDPWYVMGRDGTMSVVKSGRHFELLAANTLDDNFTASPAVSNGRLYLRGFRSLYAIGEGSKER